jgi:hypothetical protein
LARRKCWENVEKISNTTTATVFNASTLEQKNMKRRHRAGERASGRGGKELFLMCKNRRENKNEETFLFHCIIRGDAVCGDNGEREEEETT